jgi:hypothetical protein
MDCARQLFSGTEASVRCATEPKNVRQACALAACAAQRQHTRLALEEQDLFCAQLRLVRAQLSFLCAQRSHLVRVVRCKRFLDFRLQRLQLLLHRLNLRIHLVKRRLVAHGGLCGRKHRGAWRKQG